MRRQSGRRCKVLQRPIDFDGRKTHSGSEKHLQTQVACLSNQNPEKGWRMTYERNSLRGDNDEKPVGLLYIEPKRPPSKRPTSDWYVKKMIEAMKRVKETGGFSKEDSSFIPGDRTKGWHTCSCGATSSNVDYLVSVSPHPVVTNSLCIHYLQYHSDEIPQTDLKTIQLMELLP